MGKATPQAQSLYHALNKRRIKCKLEEWDGFKHIDISISWAQMDIEIDGFQHYTDAKQIEADLNRSYYSATNDDFFTMHIPNNAIDSNLDAVADAIAKVARKRYYENKQYEQEKLIMILKICLFISFAINILMVLFRHG